MKPKPPVKDLAITFTITENAQGKLGIHFSIPDHAEGTIALVLANAALDVMRGMMSDVGLNSEVEETRLQ